MTNKAFVEKLLKYYKKQHARIKRFYSTFNTHIPGAFYENVSVGSMATIMILVLISTSILSSPKLDINQMNYMSEVKFECNPEHLNKNNFRDTNQTWQDLNCTYCYDPKHKLCTFPHKIWQDSFNDDHTIFLNTLFWMALFNVAFVVFTCIFSFSQHTSDDKTLRLNGYNEICVKPYTKKAAPNAKDCIGKVLQNDVKKIRVAREYKAIIQIIFAFMILFFIAALLLYTFKCGKCPKNYIDCENNVEFCKPFNCQQCLSFENFDEIPRPSCAVFTSLNQVSPGFLRGFAIGSIAFIIIQMGFFTLVMPTVIKEFDNMREKFLPTILNKQKFKKIQPDLDALRKEIHDLSVC